MLMSGPEGFSDVEQRRKRAVTSAAVFLICTGKKTWNLCGIVC